MPAPVAVAPIAPVAPAPVAPPNGVAKPGVPPPAPGGVETKPVVAPAEVKPPAPPVEQKYKIKVDGEIVEMTQAEVERYASKGRFADKATQEAREAIKRAQKAAAELAAKEKAWLDRVKADTRAALKEAGVDPDAFARSELERKVAEGKMTQDQRDKLALEDENKRLKDERVKRDQEAQEDQKKQLTDHLQQRVEKELRGAAERAGLSMGDESFYAIFKAFEEMYELGLLPTDEVGLLPHHADRIVEVAKERLEGVQKSIRENALKLDGQPLVSFIGREAAMKISKAMAAIIRAEREQATHVSGQQLPTTPAAPTPKPSGYISPAEADAVIRGLRK